MGRAWTTPRVRLVIILRLKGQYRHAASHDQPKKTMFEIRGREGLGALRPHRG